MKVVKDIVGTLWILMIAFGTIAMAFELSEKIDSSRKGVEQGLSIDLLGR
jgi:hypothetical protein